MRKGHNGGEKKGGGNPGKKEEEKTDDYSGHYVIASSRPPDCLPLKRRTIVPKLVSLDHEGTLEGPFLSRVP